MKIITLKKPIALVIVCFAVVVAIIMCSICASAVVNVGKENAMYTVVIDAGHGGIDGGVTGEITGAIESELNLSVAKFLREDFKNAGFRVVLTRSTSAGLYGAANTSLKKTDMLNRKKIIMDASPDAVISVHMNKYPLKSRRGAQVFFKGDDKQSSILAGCVQTQLNKMEQATREYSPLTGDYYILNVSPCPAIIVECGFLSNPEDEALLTTEEYRQQIAYTVFSGVIGYFSQNTAYLSQGKTEK